MKKEVSAGVIVYYTDLSRDEPVRLYLLLHYRKGYWDFAKGKLEGSETSLEAALRELKEETGLDSEILFGFEQSLKYMFKNPRGELVNKTVTYYVGKSKTKDVQISSEHLSFKWLPYKEASQELSFENAKQILDMAKHFVDYKEKQL